MKNQLPKCPFIDGEESSQDAWSEGLEILLEELKFEEELPFKDPEEIWEEIGYILDEEDLQLSDPQKAVLRKIFDQLWPQFKD